ncbi:pilus assembly protein TadG-related protein [Embleya sp. NPDC059259]|uniref:pilus assembly protein TadG-related protein n=1 Tax=unclassified Embleya TaxID=2699296 RepID=UPI003684124F
MQSVPLRRRLPRHSRLEDDERDLHLRDRHLPGAVEVTAGRRTRVLHIGVTGEPRDRGSLAIMLAIMMAVIILLVGLVVDGGGKLRADSKADAYAQEAARAAGQAIDPTKAIPGTAIVVPQQAAETAAGEYLRAHAVVKSGHAKVTSDGRYIDVDVTIEYNTKVAAFFGVSTVTVKGHARAGLVHGIQAPEAAP